MALKLLACKAIKTKNIHIVMMLMQYWCLALTLKRRTRQRLISEWGKYIYGVAPNFLTRLNFGRYVNIFLRVRYHWVTCNNQQKLRARLSVHKPASYLHIRATEYGSIMTNSMYWPIKQCLKIPFWQWRNSSYLAMFIS